MDFLEGFKSRKTFTKNDIDSILKYCKVENKKYLYDILSIKNISLFDVTYIMNRLHLSKEKIELINKTLSQYEKRIELQEETYNDFLYRVVNNIELLEQRNIKLLDELKTCKDNIDNFNVFVEYLISKSINFIKNTKQGYVFSTIPVDKY